MDLGVPSLFGKPWYCTFISETNTKCFDECVFNFKKFINIRCLGIIKLEDSFFPEDLLNEWIIIPLIVGNHDVPLCEPPPYELLNQIVGESAVYNHLWIVHAPLVTPPIDADYQSLYSPNIILNEDFDHDFSDKSFTCWNVNIKIEEF